MVAQPMGFGTAAMTTPGNSLIPQVEDLQSQHQPKGDPGEKPRGRRRSRVQNKPKRVDEGGSGPEDNVDGYEGHSSGADGPSRKRRRSRKGLDKKFECPQEGCGKSYSRAEHLYVSCYVLVADTILAEANTGIADIDIN